MSGVTLKNLNKTYSPGSTDAFHAVKGIDLEIRDKEFMVLVGPSGCGKSTTLRMIAGLEEACSGDLCIGDRMVLWWRRLTAAFVLIDTRVFGRSLYFPQSLENTALLSVQHPHIAG